MARKCKLFAKNGLLTALVAGLAFFISMGTDADASSRQVYFNGKVHTSDAQQPSATAFVVEDGKFIYVGDDAGAQKYGTGTDLQGKRILPGIIDSHSHPVMTTSMAAFDLITVGGEWNMEETLSFIKEKANDDAHKDLPFIIGIGFGMNCRPVTAADLDKAVPDRPAIITSSDGHAYWFNSKAMELGGLTRDTKDPVPGASFYERDAQGNPTGYVVEAPAGFSLIRKLGIYTTEAVKGKFPDTQAMFNSYGITSLFEAGFAAISEEGGLQALTQLERENKLTIRAFTSYIYYGERLDSYENMLKTMKAHRDKYSTPLVRPTTLKMFTDGTLDVLSAWMREDYLAPGKGRGAPMLAFDDMLGAAKVGAGNGFNIHVHTIGDAAINMALDMYEQLGKVDVTKTMCHVQFLPEDAVQRFGAMKDIFYQSTPVWLKDDELTKTLLGEERYLRQVPHASLLKAGVTLTFGSDYPVSDGEYGVNPFNNMWTAVNRSTDDMFSPPKSEGITVKDCVDGYTINAARQLGAEDEIGSITAGKSADFIVCSDDIFEIEPQKLKDVTIEATYLRGQPVFQK